MQKTIAPILRYIFSFAAAFSVVFGLFWIMQFLIATADVGLNDDASGSLLEFVRVPKDTEVQRKKPKPQKPPQPDEPPPEPPPPAMDDVTPDAQTVAISDVRISTNIDLSASGFGLQATDGEYLPIVKVLPIYPRRAQSRGIEGYVIVEFTVTKQGTTRDIHVVEAEPSGIFDSAAMQAAAKFKYKPRVIDGEPIEVPGVRNQITFQLEDE